MYGYPIQLELLHNYVTGCEGGEVVEGHEVSIRVSLHVAAQVQCIHKEQGILPAMADEQIVYIHVQRQVSPAPVSIV